MMARDRQLLAVITRLESQRRDESKDGPRAEALGRLVKRLQAAHRALKLIQ
jgi:hypothetical protein